MKVKKIALRAVAVLLVLAVLFSFGACGKKEKMNDDEYIEAIKSMSIFDNTYEQSLPQTIIHKLIMDHFAAPLPEGKTVKKAIFIGYDGYRVDGLNNIKDNADSAVMRVKDMGGLYYAFAGGVKGVNEQATSTAPGWSAMLTGGWGDYNGIVDNGLYKDASVKTFLTKLAEQGKSASFTTSWREHTNKTYFNDTVYAIENNLPITYTHQIDDEATLYQVLKYVAKPEGANKTALEDPDVVFFTFEHTDHAGHDTGFGNQNEAYITATKDADRFGAEVLDTIMNRSTYDTEDWLIVIATDHGGINTSHGGQSTQERSTWIACNKEIEMSEENLKFAYTK